MATRRKRKQPDPRTGARVAEIRGRKDIDRDALAKRLRFHPLKMWRLETGKTHFTADDLRKVASVLEVSIEDLFAPPSTSAGAAA